MQATDVVVQSELVMIQSWPHARPDCPSLWNSAWKRRHRALTQKWSDIPDLVNMIVSFSVDESQLRAKESPRAVRDIPSPTSINHDNNAYATAKSAKALHFEEHDFVGGDAPDGREGNQKSSTIEDSSLYSLRKVKPEEENDEAEEVQ